MKATMFLLTSAFAMANVTMASAQAPIMISTGSSCGCETTGSVMAEAAAPAPEKKKGLFARLFHCKKKEAPAAAPVACDTCATPAPCETCASAPVAAPCATCAPAPVAAPCTTCAPAPVAAPCTTCAPAPVAAPCTTCAPAAPVAACGCETGCDPCATGVAAAAPAPEKKPGLFARLFHHKKNKAVEAEPVSYSAAPSVPCETCNSGAVISAPMYAPAHAAPAHVTPSIVTPAAPMAAPAPLPKSASVTTIPSATPVNLGGNSVRGLVLTFLGLYAAPLVVLKVQWEQ